MPISQQIGSSSLAKPGVCTSTTRPATPYEGQMIYETDTDLMRIWNGSAWIRTSGLGDTSFNPASSPQQIQDAGLPNGFYWLRGGSMSSALQMFVAMNLQGSRPYAKVFQSGTATISSLNLLNNNIPMKRLLVQREDTFGQSWGEVADGNVYNTTTNIPTTSGSTNVSKIFLGYGGGHGLYESSQSVCSWGALLGGVAGAGFDGGTCATFPNDLRWGLTASGTSTYSGITTYHQWEHWIWWS